MRLKTRLFRAMDTMVPIIPIDPGEFATLEPITDGCHECLGTSFEIGGRIFTVMFEAFNVDNDEYGPFCAEQCLDCGQLILMKFDNAFNVDPESYFKRLPAERRMGVGDMLRLSSLLAGAVNRYIGERNPHAVVGLPNDRVLANWYERLSLRVHTNGRLIEMRGSAYHPHRILVIHRG